MKYYVKRGDFRNQYSLVYTNSSISDEHAIADGYERITRKEAERLCVAERRRRKDDPSFAWYADAYIFPYGVDADFENYPWVKAGNLIVRI